jgi:hypothetical protein
METEGDEAIWMRGNTRKWKQKETKNGKRNRGNKT